MTLFLAGTGLFLLAGIATLFVGPSRKGLIFAGGAAAAQALLLPAAIKVLLGGGSPSAAVEFSFPIGRAVLRLDPLAAFFVLIVSLGGFLAAVYSKGYMKAESGDRSSLSRYYLFMGLLIAAMLVVVTVQNALLFLIAWEVMSLASFFLVAHEHAKDEVRRAGVYYLVAMQVGAAFLIAAFVWTSSLSGSLDFASFGPALGGEGLLPSLLFLLFFVGFGTKAGFVPFHTWLPLAHPAAPTGVSALMSGVMIKTGIYGILRILLLGGGRSLVLGYIVLAVGIVSGIYGVMNAIAQHDLKRLLAYHSIENIGLIGLGIGMGMIGLAAGQEGIAVLGFFGAVLHTFNHFTFKSLLFYGAGVVYLKTHTRDIDRLGGLVRVVPVTSALFLVGSLAICGLPLFSGFISEFALYSGLIRGLASGPFPRFAALAGLAGLAFIGVMAVLCFSKVFGIVFLGSPRSARAETPGEGSGWLVTPMAVLAVLIVFVGMLAPLVIPLLGPVVRPIAAGGADGEWLRLVDLFRRIAPALAVFGGLIVFFIALRRLLIGTKPVAVFKTWDCGYQAESPRFQYTAGSFAAPFLRLIAPLVPTHQHIAPPEGLFPAGAEYRSHPLDLVEIRLIRPLVGVIRRFLKLFTWIQTGQTQNYILYGLIFLIVLIIWIIGVR
ncbi:MAG: proton-conducting transporter membrane subunit [Candidatus Aminicenantes bacterium]|nr:proton-conducting transporter membrane subunit [Candidatus Aminicenantes bacterium]